MSTAIVVDAACDLPMEFVERQDVYVIPMGVVFAERRFFDYRDPEETRKFYADYSHHRARDVFSIPPAPDVILDFLLENVVRRHDNAILMCGASNRSGVYRNAMEAGTQLMDELRLVNGDRGYRLSAMHIMDTETTHTGQGLLALEAARIIDVMKTVGTRELYTVLRTLSRNIHVYTVPQDLQYIRARASLKGAQGLGTWSYAMGRSFDFKPIMLVEQGNATRAGWGRGYEDAVGRAIRDVRTAIARGLMINSITISYAGDTREILMLDVVQDLQRHAEIEEIRLHVSVMGTPAGINAGPGAFSIAWCG